MRKQLTALGVAALAGTGIALWPAPASAQQGAEAHVDDGPGSQPLTYVVYEAGDGEANDVTVTNGADPADYVIDDVVPIEAGEGCTHPDEGDLTRVTCTVPAERVDSAFLDVALGDMDDVIDARTAGEQDVSGGTGDDQLTAASGSSGATHSTFLEGGDGDDTLTGGNNASGDAGQDTITGTEGPDTVTGGLGRDTIVTGAGYDVVYGDMGGPEDIGGQSDEIRAGSGNDSLYGEDGDDDLYGDDGDDTVSGGPGGDRLTGGSGNDRIYEN
jgi:serralysin